MILISNETKLLCENRTCISGVGCETGLIVVFGGNLEIGSKVFAINQKSGERVRTKIGQIEKAEMPLYFVKTNDDVELLPEISFASAGGVPAQVDMKVNIGSEGFSIVRIDTDNGAFYLQPKMVNVPLGAIVRNQSKNMVGMVTGHTEGSIECINIFEAMHLLTDIALEMANKDDLKEVVKPLPKVEQPIKYKKKPRNQERGQASMENKEIKVKVTYQDGSVKEISFPMETDPAVIQILMKATEGEKMSAGIAQ